MKSRIPAASRLAKSTVRTIDQYANQQVQARVNAEMAKRESDYLRRILKIVCVANNMEFHIGATRALRFIKRINAMLAGEDDELVMAHVDAYLSKMGLEFWDAEDDV
jgi:hypothetical protein